MFNKTTRGSNQNESKRAPRRHTGSEGLLYRPASTGSGSNNDDPIELIDSDEDDTKEDLATQKIDSSEDEDDDSIAMLV